MRLYQNFIKLVVNLLTSICSLFVVILLYALLKQGVDNWMEFILMVVGPVVIFYISVAILNFTCFGHLTLWNKVSFQQAHVTVQHSPERKE